jgi:hypothetical protein
MALAGARITLWIAAAAAPQGAGAVTLAMPGRANANVSLAASGSFVAAAWSASVPGGGTDIYAAASSDGGTTFSTPARVNAESGDARVNGEQGRGRRNLCGVASRVSREPSRYRLHRLAR